MIFPEDVLIRVAICLAAVFGFFVARHIYKEKRAERPLICPIRFDCDTVVHSDYSKFFGIPVEILGMLYYFFVALSYLAFIFLPHSLPNALVGFMALISLIGFVFSAYLIAVQIFILKKFCSWCIVSAFICVCIFSLTVIAYDFSVLFGNILS